MLTPIIVNIYMFPKDICHESRFTNGRCPNDVSSGNDYVGVEEGGGDGGRAGGDVDMGVDGYEFVCSLGQQRRRLKFDL